MPVDDAADESRDYPVPAGLHWWCTCGRTDHPPFCDGSHKGTGCQPLKFELLRPLNVKWRRGLPTGAPPQAQPSSSGAP